MHTSFVLHFDNITRFANCLWMHFSHTLIYQQNLHPTRQDSVAMHFGMFFKRLSLTGFRYWALYYYSDPTLSQEFQPRAAQLSMKVASPLAKILATASCCGSNAGHRSALLQAKYQQAYLCAAPVFRFSDWRACERVETMRRFRKLVTASLWLASRRQCQTGRQQKGDGEEKGDLIGLRHVSTVSGNKDSRGDID